MGTAPHGVGSTLDLMRAIASWRTRVLYAVGGVIVVIAAAAAIAVAFAYFGGRGPRCSELTTPAQVRAEANEIYDKHFAPGGEIKGSAENNPRTLARYRASATREIRPAIRTACSE